MTRKMEKVYFPLRALGTYDKNDGEKYEGDWKNDKRNGQGKKINKC